MKLIYCMAGVYARFRNAGYTTPKYLLPWAGKPVLEHILRRMFDAEVFDGVGFVANERDLAWRGDVESVLAQFQISPQALQYVPDTRGQAETAQIGARTLLDRTAGRDDSVLFHNIDTVIAGRNFLQIRDTLATADGYIDTFQASLPIYSYVALGAGGRVTRMAEKVVISSHATTGLYGFASMKTYLRHAEQAGYQGEFYISDVYSRMLTDGCDIRSNESSEGHETVIVGTPAEYEALTGAAR